MPIPLGILAVAGAGVGGGGAFDLLETVYPSGTDTVTFTGLGSYSAYKHLQLRIVSRNANAQNGTNSITIRFNSDTGSNYATHLLAGDGSSVVSSASTSRTNLNVAASVGGGTGANIFGVAVIDILDFNNSSKNTTIRALAGNTTGTIRLSSGFWNNTAAVTSITLVEDGANYNSAARISLYGIK